MQQRTKMSSSRLLSKRNTTICQSCKVSDYLNFRIYFVINWSLRKQNKTEKHSLTNNFTTVLRRDEQSWRATTRPTSAWGTKTSIFSCPFLFRPTTTKTSQSSKTWHSLRCMVFINLIFCRVTFVCAWPLQPTHFQFSSREQKRKREKNTHILPSIQSEMGIWSEAWVWRHQNSHPSSFHRILISKSFWTSIPGFFINFPSNT